MLPWLLACVLGATATAALIAGLRAMDRRPAAGVPLAAASPPPRQRREPLLPAGDDGHLAFARVLHRAATMNLEECEARAVDRAALPPADVIEASHREGR